MRLSARPSVVCRTLLVGVCCAWLAAGCSNQQLAPPTQSKQVAQYQASPKGSWSEKNIFEFAVSNGQTVNGGLTRDPAGNLYGTTVWGGNASDCTWHPYGNGCGVVFKLSPGSSGWNETVLHTFGGAPDGAAPFYDPLLRDDAGNLYGTTAIGGNLNTKFCNTDFRGSNVGCGTIFKIDAGGNYSIVHKFIGFPYDGYAPEGGLVEDGLGNVYGTTQYGGKYNYGTIFRINPTGNETILYSFAGPNSPEGGEPIYRLAIDGDGNLYGTTQGVPPPCYGSSCGTIFRLNKNGKLKVLYTFTGDSNGYGPNQLVRDASGTLYGTAWAGGVYTIGSVWRLSPRGVFTQLHSFTGYEGGNGPYGAVLRDSKGNLYGTTFGGGTNYTGTVWKLKKINGGYKFSVLYSFPYGSSSPDHPNANVVNDPNGNLFGTAEYGGACSNCGGVFELSPGVH